MYKGVPPDPNAKRKRTHPDQVPSAQLEEPTDTLGYDLPDTYPWRPETVEWWETWRRSPQAKLFLDTDWQALQETASLVDAIWDTDMPWTTRLKAAAEVRLRVEKFGATYADRLKLRMKSPKPAGLPADSYVEGSGSATGVVRRMADYRQALGA